ncbi:hypothetical protein V497_01392 [Pseudogymnoascus sp. VKM F-4516 (FW-969)]|nr:hypothetical protein V497_01392 [Pseudogymnoascus sp. VKM F-4516 (FW-969)]
MSTDWFQCAVSYFFRNYVLAPKNGFPGYYPFLPQLYESNPEAGYFRNSVEAIALATFARVKDMTPSYFSRSRQSYGLAVSQLRSVLNNASEAYSSAPVAAVVLLWKYDVIIGEDKLEYGSPHRHGMQAILHARLASEADGDRQINRYVLATTQLQNVNEPLSSAGPASAIAPSPPYGPGLALIEGLLPRLGNIGIANAKLLQGKPPNRVEAAECVRQVRHLLKDLKTWETSLPERWRYKPYPNPTATSARPFPVTALVFPTLPVGGVWVAKWLAQLSVLRNLVLLAPIALEMGIPCEPPIEIREQVRSVAVLLCSAVPYLLGNVADDGQGKDAEDTPDIGAFFAVRALFVAAKLPMLSEEQVSWMLDRLEEIGRERGIHRALLLRESLIERGTDLRPVPGRV